MGKVVSGFVILAWAMAIVTLRSEAGQCPPTHSASPVDAIALVADPRFMRAGTATTNCAGTGSAAATVRFASPAPWQASACNPYNIDSDCAYATSYCQMPVRSAGVSGGCWFGLGNPAKCVPDTELVGSHESILRFSPARFNGVIPKR